MEESLKILLQLKTLQVESYQEPIVRDVIFSIAQGSEQQEALQKSLSAFFIGRQFSVKVTFNSTNKMTLSITPPKDWSPSTDMSVDALINEALSTIWTILTPVVRVVTFSIGLNKEEQGDLQRMLITFSTEKQFSVTVTFNTAKEMMLCVKPLRDGLNVDALIIQALTAAQHPLQQGVVLLPQEQTWTFSAPSNLGTVLGEGEAVVVSKGCSNAIGWGVFVDWPISSLVTFSDALSNEEQQDLKKFLPSFLELIGGLSLLAVKFISPTNMALKISARKDLIKRNLDVVLFINKALTEALHQRLFGSKTFTIKPLRVVAAEFSVPYGEQSITKMKASLSPIVQERHLCVVSATWPISTNRLTLHITPPEDQPRFPFLSTLISSPSRRFGKPFHSLSGRMLQFSLIKIV